MTRSLWRPVLAGLICQTAVGMVRPAVSYRALELGGSDLAIGLLAAAYALLPLVFAVAVGRLSGRMRFAAVVPILGAATLVAGSVLAVIAGDLSVLALASALVGLGNLAVLLGAQAWISRAAATTQLDAAFGWLTAGMSLGQAIGPFVTGVLVGGHGGTATTFAAAAMTSVVLAAFLVSRSRLPLCDAGGSAPSGFALLKSARVRVAIAVGVTLLTSVDILAAYLPVVGERFAIPPIVVGVLLAARGIASAVSRVLLGPIGRRFPRNLLVIASTVGGALTMVAVATTAWIPLLGIAMVLGGFLIGLGQPLTMSQVALAVPRRSRSEALAIRLVGNRIAQAVVPVLAGGAAAVLGVGAVFWLQAGLLAAAAAWAGLAREQPRPDPPPG